MSKLSGVAVAIYFNGVSVYYVQRTESCNINILVLTNILLLTNTLTLTNILVLTNTLFLTNTLTLSLRKISCSWSWFGSWSIWRGGGKHWGLHIEVGSQCYSSACSLPLRGTNRRALFLDALLSTCACLEPGPKDAKYQQKSDFASLKLSIHASVDQYDLDNDMS